MKTKYFIFAAAALALAACSSDETVSDNSTSPGNEINFRPLVSNVTRAADAHFDSANDQFKVTAFPQGTTETAYFSNVIFKTTDGATFTSTNKYYWPSGTNLDFYAWAPAGQSDNYASIPVTVASAAAEQIDLVYGKTLDWGKVALQSGTAATHAISTTYPGVVINFRHAESKVVIKLKNSNPNLKITANNVTIGNVSGSGTFAIAATNTDGKDNATITSGWSSLGTTTAVYSQDITSAVFPAEAAQAGVDMILIPQTLTHADAYANSGTAAVGDTFNGAYIQVKLKIQNSADNAYIVGAASGENEYVTAMLPLAADTWLPGKKYIYTVDLAGGGYYPTNQDTNADLDPILEGAEIKFVTVTVDGWSEADPNAVGPVVLN